MRKLNSEKLWGFLYFPGACGEVSIRTRTQPHISCIPHTLTAMDLLPASLKPQHLGLFSLSLWCFWVSLFLCDCGGDTYFGEAYHSLEMSVRERA